MTSHKMHKTTTTPHAAARGRATRFSGVTEKRSAYRLGYEEGVRSRSDLVDLLEQYRTRVTGFFLAGFIAAGAALKAHTMRGHTTKKGYRYYVVVHEGPDPATGKPRYRWHTAGASRGEAEKLLAEIVKRMHDGGYRAPDKITVSDYLLHRWLPSGHSSVAFTMTVYQHVMPGLRAQAASASRPPSSESEIGPRQSLLVHSPPPTIRRR